MHTLTLPRRQLLTGLGAASLLGSLPAAAHAAPPSFTFLFLTDTHLQPELNAAAGCDQAFRHARPIKADFVIQGGDHVFDALAVAKPRADAIADLYAKTEQDIGLKVHNTIGNHDCFGIYPKSGVVPTDPEYGKKFFQDRWGQLYYSFDHKGVHFIVLDSIGITADRDYEGRIDQPQLAWLAADLAPLSPTAPIVVISHIPLVTAFASYVPLTATTLPHQKDRVANAPDVLALFKNHNILGVLQGHTHINETVWWQGTPFITSGAVCGNWWHGTRLGAPEGFTVASISNNKLTTRYETYGFKSIDPHNT